MVFSFRFLKLVPQSNSSIVNLCRKCHSKTFPSFGSDFITNEHLDESYYLNPVNFEEIHQSIKLRGLDELDSQLTQCNKDVQRMKSVLSSNLSKLPNKLWPTFNEAIESNSKLSKVADLGEMDLRVESGEKVLRRKRILYSGTDYGMSHTSSNGCYAVTGDLARLERALVTWTKEELVEKFDFIPVIVPNMVYDSVIRACGFEPDGDRTQVYRLTGTNPTRSVCLSGTSEVPLVGMHSGEVIEEKKLPRRLCATSRCYRAEVAGSGLYRVHYFTKVEMVAICAPSDSSAILDEFVHIQKHLFSQLGLHYRLRDMPPADLGLPAARKFDIEAAFPASRIWGEISSASNCTDYQSRRFNIQFRKIDPDGAVSGDDLVKDGFVHTVNGTACATPRILLPIVEMNQEEGGRIRIPQVLRDRMGGQIYLDKNT